MVTKVVMAQLSPTMEEGRLVEWKVEEGDEVAQGDVVAEIETDKANMDVEAMGEGVLRRKVVEEGTTVPVGALIGVIAGPDEDIDEVLAEAEAGGAEAADEAPEPEEEREDEAPEEAAAPEPADRAGAPRAGAGERLKASPVARKMAREAGLELGRISGSGPGGRIVKRDVESALSGDGAARLAGPSRLEEERVELSQMRKAIARRLTQSLGPVPHFFLTSVIDMERAMDAREQLNRIHARRAGEAGEPLKIGVNDLLLKAAADALVRHPEVNASWAEDHIQRHGSVDLGIAVAVDEGLITPVLREADRKGLERIAREAHELIERARRRDLQPEEYQGATFSVSNLGMFPIEEFTAVINPPEAGILAVGRTQEEPVAVDGEVEVRRRMRVTMSCDHRVVDGATGARFLETFKETLEHPLEMLV